MITRTAHAPRWARAMMLLIPALWMGLIIGISGIEAPLKFTAPGITIPLGLGIGRRVFFAMNIVEVLLGIALLVALITLRRNHRFQALPYFAKIQRYSAIALAVLVVKTAVIRPLLASHTDAVLGGSSDGGSTPHYFYIAAELILFIVLVMLVLTAVRGLLAPTNSVEPLLTDDGNESSTTPTEH